MTGCRYIGALVLGRSAGFYVGSEFVNFTILVAQDAVVICLRFVGGQSGLLPGLSDI